MWELNALLAEAQSQLLTSSGLLAFLSTIVAVGVYLRLRNVEAENARLEQSLVDYKHRLHVTDKRRASDSIRYRDSDEKGPAATGSTAIAHARSELASLDAVNGSEIAVLVPRAAVDSVLADLAVLAADSDFVKVKNARQSAAPLDSVARCREQLINYIDILDKTAAEISASTTLDQVLRADNLIRGYSLECVPRDAAVAIGFAAHCIRWAFQAGGLSIDEPALLLPINSARPLRPGIDVLEREPPCCPSILPLVRERVNMVAAHSNSPHEIVVDCLRFGIYDASQPYRRTALMHFIPQRA